MHWHNSHDNAAQGVLCVYKPKGRIGESGDGPLDVAVNQVHCNYCSEHPVESLPAQIVSLGECISSQNRQHRYNDRYNNSAAARVSESQVYKNLHNQDDADDAESHQVRLQKVARVTHFGDGYTK